ncbi:3'(2'),5'-bisphosphate nucleotidase CysQ [Shimia ponticola]|uniref:3'(2'),5'-bisphosphate nucleotidase CysQ n=1 Tax=Shimia ponticola TaxID=2582893 RepID=UPI00210739DC|nr:3'(2'),5'-bisphosphate nucleotidase CysQ [Shimia ponticola]
MPGLEDAIDLTSDTRLLADAAQDAAKIAMSHFKSDPQVWDKGDGAGPVTEADLAVNAMLSDRLRSARPHYGWLSEETEDTGQRLTQDTTFIIDPIDGTRAFIEGSRHWGISIAIVQNGTPVAAAVAMPAKDDLYVATLGQGAHKNGQALSVSNTPMGAASRILSTKWNFRPEFWHRGVPDVDRHFRSSLAYRLALVAEGTFEGMLTLRPTWEWDIAAGALLVTEAGGKVTNPDGAAPRFNGPKAQLPGLLAAPQQVLEGLMAHGPRLSTTA